MRIFLYLCNRENKETNIIKFFKIMDLVVKTQTKKIQKGTLIMQEFLNDETFEKFWEVTVIIKNSPINTQRVCKYLANYIFENFEKLAENIEVL